MQGTDDEAMVGTCGLLDFYKRNRKTLKRITERAYNSLCNAARRAAEATKTAVQPPTRDDCRDFVYKKELPTDPIYEKIKISPWVPDTPKQKEKCVIALAGYVTERNWDNITRQNPCQ